MGWRLRVATAAVAASVVVFLSGLFLSSNRLVFKIDQPVGSLAWMGQMLPELYWIDYTGTNRFLQAHLADGDAIVSLMPHALRYYLQVEALHHLQTYTDRQIFYDVSEASGRFLDKYVGSAVLRNVDEVREGVARHARAWIVATPYNAFSTTNDKATIDYVAQNAKVVYESYQSRVYLWER
jgi:hypothetical protein